MATLAAQPHATIGGDDRFFLRGMANRVLELQSAEEAGPHLYPGTYEEYVERSGHEAPGVHA